MGYCSISYISVITPYTLTLHLTLKICMNAFEFNSNIFNKIQNENFSVSVCKKKEYVRVLTKVNSKRNEKYIFFVEYEISHSFYIENFTQKNMSI